MGYAFVNFIDPKTIIPFSNRWNHRRWLQFFSRKVCELAYGRIQGKNALFEHFQHSRTLSTSPAHARPASLAALTSAPYVTGSGSSFVSSGFPEHEQPYPADGVFPEHDDEQPSVEAST